MGCLHSQPISQELEVFGVRCPRNRSENPPKNGPPEAKFEQFLYLIKFEIKSLILLPKGKFLLNREVFSVHNSPTKSQSVATFKNINSSGRCEALF